MGLQLSALGTKSLRSDSGTFEGACGLCLNGYIQPYQWMAADTPRLGKLGRPAQPLRLPNESPTNDSLAGGRQVFQ